MIKRMHVVTAAAVLAGVLIGGTVNANSSSQSPPGMAPGVDAPSAVVTESGGCALTNQSFVATNDTSATTTSSTYVDVPNSSVSFTTAGSATSCLTVVFTAVAYSPTGAIRIRAVLGSNTVSSQTDIQFVGQGLPYADSHTFTFYFKGVRPGKHTIRIQWLSAQGAAVYMWQHTTVVLHR